MRLARARCAIVIIADLRLWKVGLSAGFPTRLAWGHDAGVVASLEVLPATDPGTNPCKLHLVPPDVTAQAIPAGRQRHRINPQAVIKPQEPSNEEKATRTTFQASLQAWPYPSVNLGSVSLLLKGKFQTLVDNPAFAVLGGGSSPTSPPSGTSTGPPLATLPTSTSSSRHTR